MKQGTTLVFLIGENALDGTGLPSLFPRWSRDTLGGQRLCNVTCGFSCRIKAVNPAYNFCLLRHNDGYPIRPFFVTEELLVGHTHFAVREPLPLPPCNIFRNGAAFFLGQAGHNGKEQLALAVEGVDPFFFKEALAAHLFQFADGDQAVDCISGKSAHRFGYDEIHLNVVFDTK